MDEVNVVGLAAGRIEGEEDDRLFQQFRKSMNDAALEEEEVPRLEGSTVGFVANPEGSTARENEEKFIAVAMVVRRRAAIDAEDAGAGMLAIDQVSVKKHGLRLRRKGARDGIQVKPRGAAGVRIGRCGFFTHRQG